MSPDRSLSLEPEERLIIAAKIDRLFTQEFDPNVHVDLAQEIVDSLIERIKPSSYHVTILDNQKNSGKISGQTEYGQVDMPFENNELRTWNTPGLNEYKIGQYVLVRSDSRLSGSSRLEIEHFWDRNLPNGNLQSSTYIVCGTKSREVVEIGRNVPHSLLGGHLIVRWPKSLWKR